MHTILMVATRDTDDNESGGKMVATCDTDDNESDDNSN